MAKSYGSVLRNQLSRIVSSMKPYRPKTTQPVSPNRVTTPRTAKQDATVKVEQPKKVEPVETRKPLSKVVADCTKRWFQETLKEAKGGDSSMQLLVGQMYYSGYGVPKDPQKGHAWISKASRSRNSVWQVSEKQPGYKASDSDSSEQENKSTP
ncbi:hypothetical protein P8452_26178 [Trifolium repens]|nr:hypothetical protein P8452_26178 [Trifolium repens]